jgi:hypothetical protein
LNRLHPIHLMSGRVAEPDWVGEEEEEHNFEVVEGGYTVAQNTLI